MSNYISVRDQYGVSQYVLFEFPHLEHRRFEEIGLLSVSALNESDLVAVAKYKRNNLYGYIAQNLNHRLHQVRCELSTDGYPINSLVDVSVTSTNHSWAMVTIINSLIEIHHCSVGSSNRIVLDKDDLVPGYTPLSAEGLLNGSFAVVWASSTLSKYKVQKLSMKGKSLKIRDLPVHNKNLILEASGVGGFSIVSLNGLSQVVMRTFYDDLSVKANATLDILTLPTLVRHLVSGGYLLLSQGVRNDVWHLINESGALVKNITVSSKELPLSNGNFIAVSKKLENEIEYYDEDDSMDFDFANVGSVYYSNTGVRSEFDFIHKDGCSIASTGKHVNSAYSLTSRDILISMTCSSQEKKSYTANFIYTNYDFTSLNELSPYVYAALSLDHSLDIRGLEDFAVKNKHQPILWSLPHGWKLMLDSSAMNDTVSGIYLKSYYNSEMQAVVVAVRNTRIIEKDIRSLYNFEMVHSTDFISRYLFYMIGHIKNHHLDVSRISLSGYLFGGTLATFVTLGQVKYNSISFDGLYENAILDLHYKEIFNISSKIGDAIKIFQRSNVALYNAQSTATEFLYGHDVLVLGSDFMNVLDCTPYTGKCIAMSFAGKERTLVARIDQDSLLVGNGDSKQIFQIIPSAARYAGVPIQGHSVKIFNIKHGDLIDFSALSGDYIVNYTDDRGFISFSDHGTVYVQADNTSLELSGNNLMFIAHNPSVDDPIVNSDTSVDGANNWFKDHLAALLVPVSGVVLVGVAASMYYVYKHFSTRHGVLEVTGDYTEMHGD